MRAMGVYERLQEIVEIVLEDSECLLQAGRLFKRSINGMGLR